MRELCILSVAVSRAATATQGVSPKQYTSIPAEKADGITPLCADNDVTILVHRRLNLLADLRIKQ